MKKGVGEKERQSKEENKVRIIEEMRKKTWKREREKERERERR